MEHAGDELLSPSPAVIVRAALRRADLDEIGGDPLVGSGFENEIPEQEFEQ